MIEKLKQKMLNEKLDFLPLKESLELFDSGIELNTMFWWVMHNEELEDNGFDKTAEELFAEYEELFGMNNRDYLRIGRQGEEFDEFTLDLCPAITLGDLLKTLKDG
tara:strand:- start:1332 stop:1649 length:318 start_codon:yes stop_codon:yes gene_type:complete